MHSTEAEEIQGQRQIVQAIQLCLQAASFLVIPAKWHLSAS